ncbi:MAG: C10 family peptidase [Bacteroidales bacterium]|nr:C10 family peptidase [Bacteroidales bacterium]
MAEKQEAALEVLRPDRHEHEKELHPLRVLWSGRGLTVLGSEGNGYALVANKRVDRAILGYAVSPFNPDSNPGLAWYLAAAEEALNSSDRSQEAYTGKLMDSLPPLMTSLWNQNAPFNLQCPTTADGSHYPSGCVATAMAQIMYYHKYPLKGQGTHQYSFHPASGDNRLISADFGQTAYGWDEMLDDYASVKYTDAQAQAVSTLLLHCGVSVDMQYTASGSGASTEEAAYGLRTYFGYHGNIGCFYRDYYSLDDWMNMVYAELNKKRPILYAASDYYGSGGHAFVIDGYDAQGRVHVNWGWGARGGNGYFDIGLLNPSGSQYSENQRMVLGIARPEEDIEYQSHIVSPNAFIVVKAGNKLLVTPGSTMYNLCGETWSGRLGLILEGNGQTWVLQEKTVTGASFRYNVIGKVDGNFGGLVALPEGIANGAYRLYAASRDERDRSWRLVRRSDGQTNSYLVTIVDGSPSSVEADGSDVWTALPAPVRQHTDNRLYEVDGRPVRQPVEGRVYIYKGEKLRWNHP